MADITDIKAIMYTEKSMPLRVNSMRVPGKVKRFKGIEGKRPNTKKFYVKLPEDAKIESLAV